MIHVVDVALRGVGVVWAGVLTVSVVLVSWTQAPAAPPICVHYWKKVINYVALANVYSTYTHQYTFS